MNINLELTREDVGTLVTALGWMAEDLGILQRAGEDDSTRTDDAIGIGDRVKVKEQDIRGLVVRFDCGHLVVLDDARNEWADDDEEGVLVFSASEVEREWSSRQATDEEYNGWSNRETWAANLHMTNDPGWDEAMRDAVIESHLGGDAKYATADVIKGVFEEVVDGDIAFEVVEMILRDVGSMWRINWVEIAEVQLSGLEEGASREPTSGLR